MTTTTCGKCSAHVQDLAEHEKWHEALTDQINLTAKNAAKKALQDAQRQRQQRGLGGV